MLDNLTLADLQIIWFILVGVLFSGYAVLDGFDLGTGTLQFFIKGDENRRLMLNAVGPVWDGNEVWLITGGGALFAAFPYVYASVFSGFYLAFMLLLLTLIFRAVSIEFRSKQPMQWWRKGWDITFSVSSLLAALLIGVAMGNVTRGIPLDGQGNFTGTFLSLLNPYAVLLGLTSVALFAMHGGIFLMMKTQGNLQQQIKRLLKPCIIIILVLAVEHQRDAEFRGHLRRKLLLPEDERLERITGCCFHCGHLDIHEQKPVGLGLHRLLLHDGVHDGHVRGLHVPQPALLHAQSGALPYPRQRFLHPGKPDGDDLHRPHRRSDRPRLLRGHLLGLPRQGAAQRAQLLMVGNPAFRKRTTTSE